MVDQVKVVEIGADAIEAVFRDQPLMAMTYPPKLMHAVVAALGRHGFIIEDRYEDEEGADAADSVTPTPAPASAICLPDQTVQLIPSWVQDGKWSPEWNKTHPDWDVSGDDA